MTNKIIENELLPIKKIIYDTCNFQLLNLKVEKESKEYNACSFELDKSKILFRTAKITPTKTGQFVTFWKRIENGPIEPFNSSDEIDFFVVNVHKDDLSGQFVFPKSVLSEKGIITTQLKEGKRAFRVYPPWDITTSKQAINTQKWQLNYFLEISANESIDLNRAKKLYSLNQ